jgi:hypothetical protein
MYIKREKESFENERKKPLKHMNYYIVMHRNLEKN